MITKEETRRALDCAVKRGKIKGAHTHDVWASDIMDEVTELNISSPHKSQHIPQYAEYEEELADIVITCMSMAAYYGIDLGKVIEAKMKYNETRED